MSGNLAELQIRRTGIPNRPAQRRRRCLDRLEARDELGSAAASTTITTAAWGWAGMTPFQAIRCWRRATGGRHPVPLALWPRVTHAGDAQRRA